MTGTASQRVCAKSFESVVTRSTLMGSASMLAMNSGGSAQAVTNRGKTVNWQVSPSFESRPIRDCQCRLCTTKLAPLRDYVRAPTRNEGLQRLRQSRAGPAHLRLHRCAVGAGDDQLISGWRNLRQDRGKHSRA